MPVRKVSNRGRNVIGRIPSLKMGGRMISYESLIEYDLILLLDFEEDVEWFEEQPFVITYKHRGRTMRYTPDLHAIRAKRNIVYECKPQRVIHKAENVRKFAAGESWCAERSWQYQVITDAQLASNYRVRNVRLLTQFARYPIAPEVQSRIRAFLAAAAAPVPLAELAANVAPERPQSLLIPILYLAFHHEVAMPLDKAPIADETPVALTPALLTGGVHESRTVQHG